MTNIQTAATSSPSSIYALIFVERPVASSACMDSINGPSVHGTFEEALDQVFEYASGRIVDCFLNEFIEWATEHLPETELSPEDCGSTMEFADDMLGALPSPLKHQVVDWYFEQARDDLTEAFYSISEASPDQPESAWDDNAIQFPRLLAEIAAVVDITDAQMEALSESMGLELAKIDELFERAVTQFNNTKAKLFAG